MTSMMVLDQSVAMHLAINVNDLDQAIAFYRVLFGTEPAKCHSDYAKFEVADPPVVFSLMPHKVSSGGVMSHLGLRLTSECAIRAVQKRLQEAGIRTREQNTTRGCYAVQTKVWVDDPDGNQWEIYVLFEDLPGGDVTGGCHSLLVADAADGLDRVVVYKGPFRKLTDSSGREYRRGEPVSLPSNVWEALRQGPASSQFIFSTPAPAPTPVAATNCTGGCR